MTTPIESAKTALASCPFCGGKPRIDLAKVEHCQLHGEPSQRVAVYCYHKCPARPRVEAGDVYNGGEPLARSKAIAAWNTRALKDLEGSAQGGVRVRVKPLDWRAPTDHPEDNEDALFMADGIGGRYSVSGEQSLHIGGRGHLLWWAHDGFTFAEFRSIDEAKAAAQADYTTRILSALSASPPLPVHQEGGEAKNITPPIDAMCMAYRRDFGLPKGTNSYGNGSSGMTEWEREGLRTTMRQIWEHAVLPALAPQPQETVETLKRENARLMNVLTKIDAIRNSIIGFQTVGWSEHIYPLVAALQEAGFEGEGYEEARENVSSLLAVTDAAETRATNAEARIAELEKENGRLREEYACTLEELVDHNGDDMIDSRQSTIKALRSGGTRVAGPERLKDALHDLLTRPTDPAARQRARAALAPDASKIEGAGL